MAAPVVKVLSMLVEFMFAQPQIEIATAVTAIASTVRRLAFNAIQGVNIVFALSADIESDSPKGSYLQ